MATMETYKFRIAPPELGITRTFLTRFPRNVRCAGPCGRSSTKPRLCLGEGRVRLPKFLRRTNPLIC